MISPFFSREEKAFTKELQAQTKWIKSHIWIASSGTTRREGLKWVGLSKNAFLRSAEAVNHHLRITKRDCWLNVLPRFHVGGLAISARAALSKSKVIEHGSNPWDPKRFVSDLKTYKVTLVSLVPTQVFDLVSLQFKCPSSLRAIVVGGGALDFDIYKKARELGWPLLPSYGLTECCSQVATVELTSLVNLDLTKMPQAKILSHMTTQIVEGRLAIKSPSVASYVATIHPVSGITLEDPKRRGWLLTEDLVKIENGYLQVHGRMQDRVKILGELVSLNRIEEELRAHMTGVVTVLAIPDARRGNKLIAVWENPSSIKKCVDAVRTFHQKVTSLWHLDHWYVVEKIPRSDLGKIQKQKLLNHLGF
jgi:O-succinylbenzoic acid--CoA ligase